ncbi:MAG: hypothetical protein ABH877_05150 [bacterium]
MRIVGVVGSFLVLLFSHVSYGQEAKPTDPAPSSNTVSREQELEARVKDLEKKIEALSARVDGPTAAPTHDVAPVDPDLARAAEQDAAGRTKAPTAVPVDTVHPIVMPVAKMNPDISFILDVGGAWYGKADHFKQGGHAMDDNGLMVQGLELAASASVDPYFRFDTYFQLTEAEVEEAYLTTLSLPLNLQVRAGLMNAAFGRQNAMHLHTWNFANPPLSHTRFMSAEHFRGPGVELSALMPLPWYLNLMGQVFGTTEELGFNSATFGSSEVNSSKRIDGLEDFLYVLRMENFFELSTDWSLLVGFSEGLGQSQFRPDARTYLHGGDLYLKWRPVSSGHGDFALALTVEYLLRDTALEDRRLRDHGGYMQLDALLTNRWMAGLRFDTTDLWQGASPDPEQIPGWQRRGSASITFMPTHFSKLRLQGDLGKERDRDGLGYAVFLQAEVSAGEHGAHKF